MRWIFLNPVKSGGWGGMENWMLKLCQGLPAAGDACLMLGRPTSRWPEVCRAHDIPYQPFAFAGDLALWRGVQLRALCRRFQPDVACVKGFRQARLMRWADPSVAIGVKLPSPDQLTDTLVDRVTFRLCVDRVLVDSHAARRSFCRHPWVLGGKIAAIHNGVACAGPVPAAMRPSQLRALLGIPDEALLVVAVGSLVPGKSFEDALQSFGSALPDAPAALAIVGEGPERAALEAAARRFCPRGNVHFTGWRDDARELLCGADVLLHPSAGEGLPNVVLEAMAAGVPAIATDVGGTREIIDHGRNGFLVAAHDIAGLSAHLALLAADRDLRARLGGQARRDAQAGFSIEAMVAGVRQVMADVARARAAARMRPKPLADGGKWVHRPEADLGPEFLKLEEPQAQFVQTSDRSTVLCAEALGRRIYLKRFAPQARGLHVSRGLRTPFALASFRTAQRLDLQGAGAVPHLAAGWRRQGLLVCESTLITGTIANAAHADEWMAARAAQAPTRRVFTAAMARWLAHLHGAGVAPHDLKASNILVTAEAGHEPDFILLDLDNCRLHFSPASRRELLRNFHQIFRSFQPLATPRDVLRFAATYRRARHLDPIVFRGILQDVEVRLLRHGAGFRQLVDRTRTPGAERDGIMTGTLA